MIESRQFRAARAWLGWSQRETARRAGLSLTAVVKAEHGANMLVDKLVQLRRMYEATGMKFSARGINYIGPDIDDGEESDAPAEIDDGISPPPGP